MKPLFKIAILTGLVVFVSSCQKEDLPSPSHCPSHQESSTATQRNSGSVETTESGSFMIRSEGLEVQGDSAEVVGGGDDDRNGGDIVGGGDDDRDGGRRPNGDGGN